MNEVNLKNLFLAAKTGDEVAYRQFLMEVTKLLLAYLRKTIKNQYLGLDAEDLVQEVLISIHKKRDLFDPVRPVVPWLYAIAKYRFIDAFRATVNGPKFTELTETLEDNFSLEAEVATLRGDNDGSNLLEGLSAKQKKVLLLAKVEKLPLASVSEETGLSQTAVKVTIHRALKLLKVKLKDQVNI